MTESEVVNEWIRIGMARGRLKVERQNLLDVLEARFPGAAPRDLVHQIQQQRNADLLHDWFTAAFRVSTSEQFLDVLKK
jgi:hypothetical protein